MDFHEDETIEKAMERIERESYQEAARSFLAVILSTIDFLRHGGKSLQFRLDIVSHTFLHPDVRAMSLDEIGRNHGKTRAAASAMALKLQRSISLPETFSQKTTASRKAYHEKRKKEIRKCKQ